MENVDDFNKPLTLREKYNRYIVEVQKFIEDISKPKLAPAPYYLTQAEYDYHERYYKQVIEENKRLLEARKR